MNRVDFMGQLEILLRNIPAAEREEALQYYNDYFDDAGKENEQAVIEALGSPARVAENIKRDLLGASGAENAAKTVKASDRVIVEYGKNVQDSQEEQGGKDGAQGGQGTQGSRYTQNDQNTQGNRDTQYWQRSYGASGNGSTYSGGSASRSQTAYAQPVKDERVPAWLIAVIATVLILLSPAILGVVLGAIGTLGGGIIGWFALIFGFGVAALGLFIAFIVLIVTGVICLFTSPWVGIAMLGGALMCGCLGILFLMLTVAMAGIITPAVFRGISRLFRFLFKKRARA